MSAVIEDHPEVQVFDEITSTAVDGCGAPVLSLTVTGLARSLSRAVQGEPDSPSRRVTAAMAAYPDFVGGTNRDVTATGVIETFCVSDATEIGGPRNTGACPGTLTAS